jgi:hypothetical protein
VAGQLGALCSLFDRGEPPDPAPLDCDGQRSFDGTDVALLGPVGNRVQLRDADLDVSGAKFFFQSQLVVAGEPEGARTNNSATSEFFRTWTGSEWDLGSSFQLSYGSILDRWDGASVASATNGGDDGRVYVGVEVTGPVNGFHHYECALHNRDNHRGVGSLRIPLCSLARVKRVGFGDLDDVPGNDWKVTLARDALVFSTTTNPLRWNSIFNFWFDTDAAPGAGALVLGCFDPGAGAPSISVPTSAPLALHNVYRGPAARAPVRRPSSPPGRRRARLSGTRRSPW